MTNTSRPQEHELSMQCRQWIRYGVVVIILIVNVGVTLTVATGGVAAVQPAEETVESACQGETDTVVVFLNNQQYDANTPVYPGTELYIGYCTANGAERPQPGETTVWDIDTENLVDISPSANGRTYRATVGFDSTVVTLDDTTLSASVDNTVRIQTQREGAVKSDLAQEPLVFSNATAYRGNEQDYRNATESITESLESLNTTTEELTANKQRVDMTVSKLQEANRTLNTLNASRMAARADAAELRRQLFNRARDGSEPHLNAFEEITAEQQNQSQAVNATMSQYATKLAAVEQRARISVLSNLAIGAVPGIALGAVIAGYRTHILGRKTRDFADFGRQLEWSAISAQLGGGGALILAGIIIAVLSGTIGAIL